MVRKHKVFLEYQIIWDDNIANEKFCMQIIICKINFIENMDPMGDREK